MLRRTCGCQQMPASCSCLTCLCLAGFSQCWDLIQHLCDRLEQLDGKSSSLTCCAVIGRPASQCTTQVVGFSWTLRIRRPCRLPSVDRAHALATF